MTRRLAIRLSLTLATLFLVGCEIERPPEIIGGIKLYPVTSMLGEPVRFTGEPVRFAVDLASESTPPFYVWDFGNGQTSTAPRPEHTYTTTGQYEISVTVSNSEGSDTATERLTVADPSQALFSNVFFWTDRPHDRRIGVIVNVLTRKITTWHIGFPGCLRDMGMAGFMRLPYGAYEYWVISEGGFPRHGTVALYSDCVDVML